MKAVNHFFAGSNTYRGFYGFFDELFRIEGCKRLYVLKGGPGVGKSSLMKRVALYASERGMDVEYFHCSSDPDALDGVIIKDTNNESTMLVDGTAPHIVDPVLPGAADEIINLGTGLNTNMLYAARDELQALNKRMKGCFAAAHGFAYAAEGLRRAAAGMVECNAAWFELPFDQLLADTVYNSRPQSGKLRNLFLSSVTPMGMNLPQAAFHAMQVCFINAPWCCDLTEHFCHISERAAKLGNETDICHDPVNADLISHIILNGKTIITASQEFMPYADSVYEPTHALAVPHNMPQYAEFLQMAERAAEALSQAKRVHDMIEHYYIEAMEHTVNEIEYQRLIKAL